MVELLYEELSYKIRGVCFDLYKELGSGHKESVYQNAFNNKIENEGIGVQREFRIPVFVDGKKVGTYIPDFVIDDKVMVELKAKRILTKEDRRQFWHYLKVTKYRLGFLINFGKPGGVEIVRRICDKVRIQRNSM